MEKKKLNDKKKLLEYLIQHKEGITPLQAWEKLGIYRTGARIFDLRADGHEITTELVEVECSDGEIARVAKYIYKGECKK